MHLQHDENSDPPHVAAGDAFLAVTGASQIKVYDRDGVERGESAKGDMYIRDLRNTKGHVSPCTGGQWHPADRCCTCPRDLACCASSARSAPTALEAEDAAPCAWHGGDP